MATLEDQKLGNFLGGQQTLAGDAEVILDWFMKNNAKAYMVLLD